MSTSSGASGIIINDAVMISGSNWPSTIREQFDSVGNGKEDELVSFSLLGGEPQRYVVDLEWPVAAMGAEAGVTHD